MLDKMAILPIAISSLVLVPSTAPEVPSNKVILRTDASVLLDVPFISQIDDLSEDIKAEIGTTACGPASITMSLRYLGLNISLTDVIDRLPLSVYVRGKKFYKLTDGPKYFGKLAVEIDNAPSNIYQALYNGNPVILNIQNYDGITGHAVVVTGIKGFDGENAKSLIVNDPFRGPYREFIYVNKNSLKQPEGFINPIGTLKPFYVRGISAIAQK